MSDRLRFGVLGCGNFGAELSAYIAECADIVAVCDPNKERADELAAKVGGGARVFTEWRQMLASAALDAVAITGPNFMHADATVDAAEVGLHVFCEKPMALNVPDCWRMITAAQRAGVKLMVGHKRRLRPAWARMIELMQPDFLDAPLSLQVNAYCDYRGTAIPNSWWSRQEAGGLLFTNASHVIDCLNAMAGAATSVSAVYGPTHDAGFEFPDIMHVRIRYALGAVADIACSTLYPLARFRQSQGPRGQCRNGGFAMFPEDQSARLVWQRLDEEQSHDEQFNGPGFDHAYRRELRDFIRWIKSDAQPCLTWREGLRCVEIMEGAHRSANEDGREIPFPLHPELENVA